MVKISMGSKFILIAIIILILSGALTIFYVQMSMTKSLTDKLDDNTESSAKDLAADLRSSILNENITEIQPVIDQKLVNFDEYEYILIYNNAGVLISSSPQNFTDNSILNKIDATITGTKTKFQTLETNDGTIRNVAVPVDSGNAGYLHIGASTNEIDSAVMDEIKMVTLVIIILLVIGSIIIIVSIKLITRPMKSLLESTERLAHGRMQGETFKTIQTRDELGLISRNLQELTASFKTEHESLDTKLVQSKHELEATSQALRASESKYKTLVDSLRSAILTVTKTGEILTINKGGVKLLGCSSKDDAKRYNLFKDFGIPKEDCDSFIKILRDKGFVENFETILIKKTGEKAIIRIYSQLVKGPDNQIDQINSIIRDITTQKLAEAEKSALEEELFHAEKLASIGQLAAGVAHEINNPLTNISLLTTSISRKTKDKVILDKLNKLTHQRKIAARIVNDLLQFSRKTEPKFKKVNLAHLISGALDQLVQNDSGTVTIENRARGEELWIRGDPDLLRQVFINIFENAYDEMPDGGKMVIHSRSIGIDFIEIEISDSGPGIPENIIGKIFDPFFSTKQAEMGTGLGLSICHGIIKTHEGKIYAQNHEPHGASFFIQLPRWKDEV